MPGVRLQISLAVKSLVMVIKGRNLEESRKAKMTFIIRNRKLGMGEEQKRQRIGVGDVQGFAETEIKETGRRGTCGAPGCEAFFP